MLKKIVETLKFMATLRERFELFMSGMHGIEVIDNLRNGVKNDDPGNRADYLAVDRTLIIEQKSLESDPEEKIEKVVKPHRDRAEFPQFFGTSDLSNVLARFPDQAQIQDQINQKVTTSVRDAFRAAHNQIVCTKQLYDLPNAQGLLVILNEAAEVISPDLIFYQLSRLAQGRDSSGNLRYEAIHGVLLISEAHAKVADQNTICFPLLFMPVNFHNDFAHEPFVADLHEKWAEFNGASCIVEDKELESIRAIGFERRSTVEERAKTVISRQASWERYYEFNPYFRKFDMARLRWFYEVIVTEIGKGMMKKALPEQTHRAQFYWMEVYTHFMCEVEYRGIDLREFSRDRVSYQELDSIVESRFGTDAVPSSKTCQ